MTLLFGFAAVNTGNNLLFLIVSALLGFMTVSGVLGWLNIRGVRIQTEVPDEIYRGLPTLVTLRLSNTKRFFPSFLIQAKILEKSVSVTLIRRGKEELTSFIHVFDERGALAIPYGEICSPYPINFFVRCRRTPIDRRFLVFPAPVRCAMTGSLDETLKNGALASPLKGYEGDVSRIADYTGSEPLKLIHWRLSAKFEEFKVKEMNASAEEPVILDFESLPGKDLEENLSCAVFLINLLIRRNRPVGLRLPDRVVSPAVSREHRLRLLSELAVYGKD